MLIIERYMFRLMLHILVLQNMTTNHLLLVSLLPHSFIHILLYSLALSCYSFLSPQNVMLYLVLYLHLNLQILLFIHPLHILSTFHHFILNSLLNFHSNMLVFIHLLKSSLYYHSLLHLLVHLSFHFLLLLDLLQILYLLTKHN